MSDIRVGTIDDVPALVEIAREFSEKLKLPIPFDDDVCGEWISSVIKSDIGEVFVSGDPIHSSLGVVITPMQHAALTQAVELWWWSDGPCGLRLLNLLEIWAKERGAAVVSLCSFKPYERALKARGYGDPQYTRIKVL